MGCAQGGPRRTQPVDADLADDAPLDPRPPLDAKPAEEQPIDARPADARPADGGPTPLDAFVDAPIAVDATPDAVARDATVDAFSLDAPPMMDTGNAACDEPTASCEEGRSVGMVSGDEEETTAMASGTGSEWVWVTVTDTGGVYSSDNSLRVTLELSSTGDAEYDLVAYHASASSSPLVHECDANEMRTSGAMDTLSMRWADVPNGIFDFDGDGRIISVGVQHAGGSCDGGWELTVRGGI